MCNPSSRPSLVTFTLILGAFSVVMSATAINIAVVPMMEELALSADVAQLFSSLFLGVTILTAPLAAWLASRWGARRVFIATLLTFVVGSLVVSVGGSLPVMLMGRGVQGGCSGIIQPLAMFLTLETAAPERQGRAMGAYGLGVVLAPAIGPTLAGWGIDWLGWRSAFVLGVPTSLTATVMAWWLLPADRAHAAQGRVFDLPGFLLLLALVCLLVTWPLVLARAGWGASALLLVAGVLVFAFWRVEARQAEPLVPVRLLRRVPFRAAAWLSAAYGTGLYGATFLIPILMQGALGFSAVTTGNLMLLGGVALVISTQLAGRLVDRYSPRLVLYAGLGCFVLSCVVLAAASTWGWIAVGVVVGRIALGMIIPGLYSGMARVVEADALREATSTIVLLRQAGGAFGVALIGLLLSLPLTSQPAAGLALGSGGLHAAVQTLFLALALVFALAFAPGRRMRSGSAA